MTIFSLSNQAKVYVENESITLKIDDEEVHLYPQTKKVLLLLIESSRKNWSVSYTMFANRVWGDDYYVDENLKKSLRQNIRQLRKYLGYHSIHTSYDGGYQLTLAPKIEYEEESSKNIDFENNPSDLENFIIYACDRIRDTIDEIEKTKEKLLRAEQDNDIFTKEAYEKYLKVTSDKLDFFYIEYERSYNMLIQTEHTKTTYKKWLSALSHQNNNNSQTKSTSPSNKFDSNNSLNKIDIPNKVNHTFSSSSLHNNPIYIPILSNQQGNLKMAPKFKPITFTQPLPEEKKIYYLNSILENLAKSLHWSSKMQIIIANINDDLKELFIL